MVNVAYVCVYLPIASLLIAVSGQDCCVMYKTETRNEQKHQLSANISELLTDTFYNDIS